MLTIIAAVAQNGVIGRNNDIPWYVPADFKHFKETTLGSTIIMGASTWDSLPERPLSKRRNIIVSRTRSEDEGEWFVSLDEALEQDEEAFIIGGAQIYHACMDKVDRLLISRIPAEPSGDCFFPKIGDEWFMVGDETRDGFHLEIWRRKSSFQ